MSNNYQIIDTNTSLDNLELIKETKKLVSIPNETVSNEICASTIETKFRENSNLDNNILSDKNIDHKNENLLIKNDPLHNLQKIIESKHQSGNVDQIKHDDNHNEFNEKDLGNKSISKFFQEYKNLKLKYLDLHVKYTTEKTHKEVYIDEVNKLKQIIKKLKEENSELIHKEEKTKILLNDKEEQNKKLCEENKSLQNIISTYENTIKKFQLSEDNHIKIIEERIMELSKLQNELGVSTDRNSQGVRRDLKQTKNNRILLYNINNKNKTSKPLDKRERTIFDQSNEFDQGINSYFNSNKKRIILNQMNHTNIFNNIQPLYTANNNLSKSPDESNKSSNNLNSDSNNNYSNNC